MINYATHQKEDFRSEDVVFSGYDDGLVADVVVEMVFDPFGIVPGHRVVRRPKGHAVVFLGPEEETAAQRQTENQRESDGEPGMPADQIAQSTKERNKS